MNPNPQDNQALAVTADTPQDFDEVPVIPGENPGVVAPPTDPEARKHLHEEESGDEEEQRIEGFWDQVDTSEFEGSSSNTENDALENLPDTEAGDVVSPTASASEEPQHQPT